MKPVVQMIRKNLGGAILFSDDVRSLASIMQEIADPQGSSLATEADAKRLVVVSVPGYELSADDYNKLEHDPTWMTMNLASKSVTLTFSQLECRIEFPDTTEGYGVAARVQRYLDTHCRPAFHFLALSPATALATLAGVFTCLIMGVLPHFARVLSELGSWGFLLLFGGTVGVSCAFLFVSARLGGVFLYRTARKDHASFWHRNRDQIAQHIISGTVILILGIILGRITAPEQSAQTAQAEPSTSPALTESK